MRAVGLSGPPTSGRGGVRCLLLTHPVRASDREVLHEGESPMDGTHQTPPGGPADHARRLDDLEAEIRRLQAAIKSLSAAIRRGIK